MKTKASEGRKLLASFKFVFQHMVPQNSHHSTLRFHCIKFLAEVYEEISAWSTDSGIRVAELDVKRWSFMENCRWKTCNAWRGNVGDGCCTTCTRRCTICNTTWRSKWLRVEIRERIGAIVTNPKSEQV